MSEEEQPKNGNAPYFVWKLPFFGMEIKVGGREVFSILLLFAIATPVLYLILIHDEKTESILRDLVMAQEATTYVLTLSQEERTKLQLQKPKRIREMERNFRD